MFILRSNISYQTYTLNNPFPQNTEFKTLQYPHQLELLTHGFNRQTINSIPKIAKDLTYSVYPCGLFLPLILQTIIRRYIYQDPPSSVMNLSAEYHSEICPFLY